MVCKTEFYLKNYFCTNKIEISYNNEKILIEFDKSKNDEFKKIEAELESKSETGLLTLFNEKNHDKSQKLAIDIISLLSLALGENIIFDRCLFREDNLDKPFEKEMVVNTNKGEQIIPNFEIKEFLEKTLPIYNNLSDIEKNEILVITDYLNQTSNGYIEDRILRMAQAWEIAAMYWVKETIVLTDELSDLREKIKNVIKIWKQERNFNDVDGELGKKILSSIDEEINLIKLNRLISSHQLKKEEINLELKKIKKLRDCVVHTGKITNSGISPNEAIFILLSGIQGLQLIILKRLGYDGLVDGTKDNGIDKFGNRDRWHRTDRMAFYFD